MTKTERILKLASLSPSERKRRYKDTALEDVEIFKEITGIEIEGV